MKKFCFLLTVLCILLLCGCHTVVPADTPTTPTIQTAQPTVGATAPVPTTEPETEPTLPVQNDPAQYPTRAAVIFTPMYRSVSTEDGEKVVMNEAWQEIRLDIPGKDAVSEQIRFALMEQPEERRTWADEIAQSVLDLMNSDEPMPGSPLPLFMETDIAVTRLDQRLVSFFETDVEYYGGAHSNTYLSAMTFDLASGEQILLSDLLTGPEMADVLEVLVLQNLHSIHPYDTEPEIMMNPGYENVISRRLHGQDTENWYLAEDGLVFFFAPYDVASYGFGSFEARLPYEVLDGILREAYFPTPTEPESGFSVSAALASDIDCTAYEKTLELTLDEEADWAAVFSDRSLRDVRVTLRSEDEGRKEQTLLAASCLEKEDLLLIRTFIPDAQPNLYITFQSGSAEPHTYGIFQSGMDGSILLVEP